jgi:hypothetical protein
MNVIFRSVWVVWFDTYQGPSRTDGSKDFGLESLDPNYVRGISRPPRNFCVNHIKCGIPALLQGIASLAQKYTEFKNTSSSRTKYFTL